MKSSWLFFDAGESATDVRWATPSFHNDGARPLSKFVPWTLFLNIKAAELRTMSKRNRDIATRRQRSILGVIMNKSRRLRKNDLRAKGCDIGSQMRLESSSWSRSISVYSNSYACGSPRPFHDDSQTDANSPETFVRELIHKSKAN